MIRLPYGSNTVDFSVEDVDVTGEATVEILDLDDETAAPADASEILRYALEHPLKTKRLREIVACAFEFETPESDEAGAQAKKKDIVIVVDDHTRNTPTEEMIDALVEEIEIDTERVIVLVACGTHAAPGEHELKRILGKHYGRFRVCIHDCDDERSLVYLGETSRGTPVFVNSTYMNAAVRVLTGDITLHYYAGFGGGRKSILPGISGRETIKRNHALLTDENARTGIIKGNPVHEDMCEVAAMAPPDFVLNIVSDSAGRIVAAFAGDMDEVFRRGVSVASEIFIRRVPQYDMLIVSAGGFPKDRNLYQASKAIEHCQSAVVSGGTLILVAECRDGIGDAIFEEWMNSYDYEDAEKAVKTNFVLGGHKAYYLRKTMRRIRICIVSSLNSETLHKWGIQSYENINDAIKEEISMIQKKVQKRVQKKEKDGVKIGVVRNGMDSLLVV